MFEDVHRVMYSLDCRLYSVIPTLYVIPGIYLHVSLCCAQMYIVKDVYKIM